MHPAAFFNLARDNFYRTMMDILNQIGFKADYIETELDNRLSDIIDTLNGETTSFSAKNAETLQNHQVKLKQLLFRNFPILAPIATDILKYRHNIKLNESKKQISLMKNK